MKFVRSAQNSSEQNLSIIQDAEQIYFEAIRSINPKQELKVSYSPHYASVRNLTTVQTQQQVNQGKDVVFVDYF